MEAAEKRKNSCLCRDFEVSLPHELSPSQRQALADKLATYLADRYDTPALFAIHKPEHGDERNHHLHCLLPTRALTRDGLSLGAKLRVLDDRTSGSPEIKHLRQDWQDMCNAALAAAGIDARIDMGRTRGGHPASNI